MWLAQGLVLAYTFDENYNDWVLGGGQFTPVEHCTWGTLLGIGSDAPNWAPGPAGSCFYTIESTLNTNIPTQNNFINGLSKITIASRLLMPQGSNGTLIMKNDAAGMYLEPKHSDTKSYFYWGTNATATGSANNAVPNNTWGTFIATADGANATVYWEGNQIAQTARPGVSLDTGATPIQLGDFGAGGLAGYVDYLYLYTVLSADEMQLCDLIPL